MTVEELITLLSDYIVFASQLLAMFVIGIGMVKALWTYVKDALLGEDAAQAIQESRAELGHSFSLGLGFLIGASILKTTVAPSWTDIGQLSSIIAIRTVLNFFLTLEISKHMAKGVEMKQEAELKEQAASKLETDQKDTQEK
jgi:uncharacterized membrane protein